MTFCDCFYCGCPTSPEIAGENWEFHGTQYVVCARCKQLELRSQPTETVEQRFRRAVVAREKVNARRASAGASHTSNRVEQPNARNRNTSAKPAGSVPSIAESDDWQPSTFLGKIGFVLSHIFAYAYIVHLIIVFAGAFLVCVFLVLNSW